MIEPDETPQYEHKKNPVMEKTDSIEAVKEYDIWFKEQVEAAINSTEPVISHDEVMASIRKKLAAKR